MFVIKKLQLNHLTLCALFVSLSTILSQLFIPIGPVPINMTHVSIFVSAGLLGVKYGTFSQMVFVLMGAIGIPVFTGFTGGPGILFGPTGGFIVGYVSSTFVTGLLIDRFGHSVKVLVPAVIMGWVVTYVCGITWLIYRTNIGLMAALPLYMLPFLPGDALKTFISVFLINRLRPVLQNKVGFSK